MNEEFSVRYAETLSDRTVAGEFVDRLYLPVYKTTPPLADVYAVVEKGGEMVACIGIGWPDQGGTLELERIYCLKEMPLPLSRENGMQYYRWASVNVRAGTLAIYAATCYALNRGKRYGLVEHNDRVLRHVQSLGIVLWDVEYSLDLSAVPEHNRHHYATGGMRPYLVYLKQIADVLSACASLAVLPD